MSGSRIERAGLWVLAAVLFFVPLAYGPVFADPFTIAKRSTMLVAALLLWGLALAAGGPERPARAITPIHLLVLALALSAGLAWAVSFNRRLALWGLVDLVVGIGLMFATLRFARSPRDVAFLMRTILVAAAVVAAGSLVQLFVPAAGGGMISLILPPSRGGSTLGDPGLATQFLLLALPIGIGALALSSPRGRPASAVLLGVVVAALLYIGRPEGWWIACGSMAVLGTARLVQVVARRSGWRALLPDPGGSGLQSVLIVGIVLLTIVALSRLTFMSPSGRPTNPLAGTSLLTPTTGNPSADRAAALPRTLTLLKRHPLGVGPQMFRHAFLEVAWTGAPESPFSLSHQAVHSGNTFLEAAAETGILGGIACVLLVLLLWAQSLLAAARAAAEWGVVAIVSCGVLGTLVAAGFLGAMLQEPAPALLFWVTAAFAQAGFTGSGSATFVRWYPTTWRPRYGRLVAAAIWIVVVCGSTGLLIDKARAARLMLMGQGAYYAGQYEAALLALGQPPVHRSPDHLPHVLAGSSYLRLRFYDMAANEFGLALKSSPYFVSAYLGRAAAREAQGRWDEADADYRSALRIWPGNPDIHLALANLDATRGRIDDALDDYRKVMEINPDLAETYFRMGELFLRRNQIDEAIEAFLMCQSKNPKFPRNHLRLGDAYFQKGLQEMGERYYQAAVAAAPEDVEPRLRLANAEHALGKYCDAREALEGARDLETDLARRDMILDLIKKVDPDCLQEQKGTGRKR